MELIITACLPSRAPHPHPSRMGGGGGCRGESRVQDRRTKRGHSRGAVGLEGLARAGRCVLHPQRARKTPTGIQVFPKTIQTDKAF